MNCGFGVISMPGVILTGDFAKAILNLWVISWGDFVRNVLNLRACGFEPKRVILRLSHARALPARRMATNPKNEITPQVQMNLSRSHPLGSKQVFEITPSKITPRRLS